MDEQEAIKRLKNSDEKAFSFLYKSYWPKVITSQDYTL